MEFTPELMMSMMNSTSQKQTSTKLEDLEEERNSKIIIIRHDINKNSFMSLLNSQQELSREDALSFIKTLRSIPEDKTVEIILTTPGGSLAAAEVIVNAILNHKGKVIVYIPEYACSTGTIISLAANEIYLGKNAFMGPADPQFRFGYSASSLISYTDELKNEGSWITDIAKLVKSEAKKSMDWTADIINRIYEVRDREMPTELYDTLFSGRYNHERPLFFKDLDKLIENLHEGIPDAIYELR